MKGDLRFFAAFLLHIKWERVERSDLTLLVSIRGLTDARIVWEKKRPSSTLSEKQMISPDRKHQVTCAYDEYFTQLDQFIDQCL